MNKRSENASFKNLFVVDLQKLNGVSFLIDEEFLRVVRQNVRQQLQRVRLVQEEPAFCHVPRSCVCGHDIVGEHLEHVPLQAFDGKSLDVEE